MKGWPRKFSPRPSYPFLSPSNFSLKTPLPEDFVRRPRGVLDFVAVRSCRSINKMPTSIYSKFLKKYIL